MSRKIEIEGLLKTYNDVRALEIDTLSIDQGQTFGIVGNNGAGKTTLLRCVLDLIKVDRGAVRIGGEDVRSGVEWKRATGAYLDPAFVIGYLRPLEYLDLVARLYGVGDVASRLEAFGSLFRGDILHERKLIRDLSAGNVDKVGITAALLPHPSLVILDEPFAHLDPAGRAWLKEYVREDRSSRGTTYLISSHDLADLLDVGDRLVLLRDGLVIEDVLSSQITLSELERRFLAT